VIELAFWLVHRTFSKQKPPAPRLQVRTAWPPSVVPSHCKPFGWNHLLLVDGRRPALVRGVL
jgi:hypothetical protein